jgi:hypothetical protein
MHTVLANDPTIAAMQSILLASTAAGREVSGVCRLREATPDEHGQAGLGDGVSSGAWLIEDFRTTTLGDGASVQMARAASGELSFHTHPGLKFSMAGFSELDRRAVEQTRRALLVIGYTVVAPEILSVVVLATGWNGLLVGAAIQGVLRAEAAGHLEPRLSRVGIAARLLLPDGRQLPVRALRADAWRRAIEASTFEIDRVTADAANATSRWARGMWRKLRP